MRSSARVLAGGVLAVAALAGSVLAGCDSTRSSPPSDPSLSPVPTSVAALAASTVPTGSAVPDTPPSGIGPASGAPDRVPTSASPTAATSGTRQVLIRPVTSAGAVAQGWSVHTEDSTIDCSGGLRSPVSQSDDVLFCSPSAASAIACWHAAQAAYAYCLPDPRTRIVDRYSLQGSNFPAAHPVEIPPAPAALDLADGTRCSVRDGGAAARLSVNPDWVPYYFCGPGEDTAVWSQPDATDGGVERGDGDWSVQLAATDGAGPLHATAVAVAYFVGTA